MIGIFKKSKKAKLSKFKWYEKVAKYLDIPHWWVIRALGEKSGFTQDDKVAFANTYDGGKE